MKISPTGNYTIHTETSWGHPAAVHPVPGQKSPAPRFDSILLSTTESARRNQVQRDLGSRLTQEVRTATSSGDVRDIREQIQNGTYRADPREIARKMLLVGVV